MENKRSGFSFKVVGVVGFVLLTFILIRILGFPNAVLPSEMVPNFLMLLLGILVLGSSFILLALGRIVEILQDLRSSKALLQEIRDETERVRIESQYIYEVQKDTLVKLTSVDEKPVVDPVIAHEKEMAQQAAQQRKGQTYQSEELDQDVDDLLNIDKATLSSSASSASSASSDKSGLDKIAQASAATGSVSRGASFAVNRLNKDKEKDQGRITPVKSADDVVAQDSQYKQDNQVKSDIQNNTDESTWSTLAGVSDISADDMTSSDMTSAEGDVRLGFSRQDQKQDKVQDQSDSQVSLHFDKVDNLPVTDDEYDRAAVDGSDDVVDDAIQTKTWKPVDADELLNGDVPSLDLTDKITEVKDADINESLDAAVVKLKSENFQERNLIPETEVLSPPVSESQQDLQADKPVFEDRLSQTEKNIENIGDKAVRFGSFPGALKVDNNLDEVSSDWSDRADLQDAKPNFTLEDLTGESFEDSGDDFSALTDKSSTSSYSVNDRRTQDIDVMNRDSSNGRSENVFASDSSQDSARDKEQDTLEKVFSTSKNSTDKTSVFKNKDFRNVEDGFETAEDSFDDIREVFDTQAKKLATDVKSMTAIPSTQDRIKDSLERASDKVARETSDVRKNLN